jgi:formylglycine-generating enzyme required for sulfatase activity
VEKNQLGFYGLTGENGNLWQWCLDLLPVDPRSKNYRLKRGGSWDPHCGRHDHWPKKEACHGFCQITFRVARTADAEKSN